MQTKTYAMAFIVATSLFIISLVSCSSDGVSVPDRDPDAGEPPPTDTDIEDCCKCLTNSTSEASETARACFYGSLDQCEDTMLDQGGVTAPADCLSTLCKKECAFLNVESDNTEDAN